MPSGDQARRVVVHAGFHKTGTSTVQNFLRSNGKNIWPRCALVLPKQLRSGAGRMAVRYSRFGTAKLLTEFGDYVNAVLSTIDIGNRNALLSDEALAGRMPGRDGQLAYHATPDLMARAEAEIRNVFGSDTDVVFHFTTRSAQSWLRSTYKHNLRTLRLTMDEAEYTERFAPAADLDGVVDAVKDAVTGTVLRARLEDLTTPIGPAQPLVDLINLPDHRLKHLKPHKPLNLGPDDAVIAQLLALNRSDLDDDAVVNAKRTLVGDTDE